MASGSCLELLLSPRNCNITLTKPPYMDFSTLPETAFIHPAGNNREQVKALLEQVMAQILDYLAQAQHHPPLPDVTTLPTVVIPDTPVPNSDLLAQIRAVLMTSMNPAHPGYVGHMDPLSTTFSIIGDWLSSALNNNMLSVEMSPLFSRLEPLLLKEMTQLFAMGAGAGGVLTSGGSLANLQAVAVARNVKCDVLKKGLAGLKKPPVFFTSTAAHTSIKKAAMLLGLGTNAAISIPTNDHGQMDIPSLEAAIHQARADGQHPFMVVATAGTTVTGNIDPLAEIGAMARTYDLWFHVDAAYGGALVFSETHRDRLQGIEQADSITFNPQKWLYVAKTCAMVLFKEMDKLQQHFQLSAPYMNAEQNWSNLGEITVQGTRRADILKLWLSLQHLGKAGYGELIDSSYALTATVLAAVRQRPYLTLASEPEMNLICFRGSPASVAPDRWNNWNAQLQSELLQQGNIFVSLPEYRGHCWLRVVLLNPFTTEEEIRQLFEICDRFAARTIS